MRKRFIFFTKTEWSEPPRIRHQLAHLLSEAGHEICFFQKPFYVYRGEKSFYKVNRNITLTRHRQLINHKLRVHPFFHAVNSLVEKYSIKKVAQKISITTEDVIVNFNYEYYFIRDLFPNNKIILIINDDFWSRSFFGFDAPLKSALKKTIESSDCTLTVSIPLMEELGEYADVDLFYPWSNVSYIHPSADSSTSKDTLLFWGYINNKIDYDFVARLSSALLSSGDNYRIIFVGPQECGKINILSNFSNVEYYPPSELDDLDLSNVFAGFIPYRSGVKSIDAISLPNKALQLLARGIPLAITGMPHFISQPFVYRLSDDIYETITILRTIHDDFFSLQPSIKSYVESNCSLSRYHQFISYL